MLILNIISFIGAFAGILCLAHKKSIGFLIFTVVVEPCVGTIGYVSGNYGLTASAIMYIIVNIYGYKKWRKA